MGQLNIYNPTTMKVIDRTSSMLDTPPQDKLDNLVKMKSTGDNSFAFVFHCGTPKYKGVPI